MKRIIRMLLFILVATSFYSTRCQADETVIAVNETNFPDAVFRAYIQKNIDKDRNGYLAESEIKEAKEITIDNGTGIYSDNRKIKKINLKGISYFKYLKKIDIESKSIENFYEIYNLTALEKIQINTDTSLFLNFSSNLELTDIRVTAGNIRNINVLYNEKLERLDLETKGKKIIQVDLRNNQELKNVKLSVNCSKVIWPRKHSITDISINMSYLKTRFTIENFSELSCLYAVNWSSGDNVEEVKIVNCPKLSEAYVIGGKKLKKVQFSNLKKLKTLQIGSEYCLNQVTFKNVPNMKILYLDAKKLGKVSWNAIKNLRELSVFGNRNIKTLNLKKLKNLRILEWRDGSLKKINLKNHPQLKEIDFEGNKIKGNLDLSGLKKLYMAVFCDNQLTGVKIGKRVYGLDIAENNIKGVLDLSYSRSLYWLYCNDNEITEIKLSKKLKSLDELDCHYNNLKTLDLSHTNVRKIYAEDNPELKDVYLLKKHKVHRFDKKVKKHYKRK